MSARAGAVVLVLVAAAAAAAWHFTPYRYAALWGNLGCFSAYQVTRVIQPGCEPPPRLCPCK